MYKATPLHYFMLLQTEFQSQAVWGWELPRACLSSAAEDGRSRDMCIQGP